MLLIEYKPVSEQEEFEAFVGVVVKEILQGFQLLPEWIGMSSSSLASASAILQYQRSKCESSIHGVLESKTKVEEETERQEA